MSAPPGHAGIVQRALAIAGIAPERFGPARLLRLTHNQRALYHWILSSFARAGQPAVDELCELASDLGLEIEDTSTCSPNSTSSTTTPAAARSLLPTRSPPARAATPS